MNRSRRRWRQFLAAALGLVSLLASSPALARARADLGPAGFLHVVPPTGAADLPRLADASGREVLLRGVAVNGLEDYYQDSSTPLAVAYPVDPGAYAGGRCPRANSHVETMAVCAFDAAQVRSFGFDVVRLGLSWSLLEPAPGRLSARYLERVAQVVGWFRAAGVRVVLDLHQDAWSKYVFTPAGGTCPPGFTRVAGRHESDGAPLWATMTRLPVCAAGGVRELDLAVQDNFQAFLDDVAAPDGVGLQEHYAAVLAELAARFGSDPTVVGYDLMNEPSPGFLPGLASAVLLLRLDAKLVAAMRAAVPGFRQLVFLEPEVTRDVTDQGLAVAPWSGFSDYPQAVYAPHLYPGVFTPDSTLADAAGTPRFLPARESYLQAERDARLLRLPLWVGEFGTAVTDDDTYLTDHYAEQDRAALGSALWVWKEFGRSGFSVEHEPFGRGVPYPSRVRVADRAYPSAVAGHLVSLAYDPGSGRMALVATGALAGGAPTLVHVPGRDRGVVRVTGGSLRVLADPAGGRLAVVRPGGRDYTVTVG